MSIIDFENVGRTYGSGPSKFVALEGINLQVPDRQFMAIVGPSGCGKTTLMRMVAGLDYPTEGAVKVDGETITAPGPDRAVVFQQFALFPWKTVRQNIAFVVPQTRSSRVKRK